MSSFDQISSLFLQFAAECVELLRHAPDCRLPFNKFIPSYHHHFGRQCRVADYGFSKLIELFEAVPGTVEVTEDADGERLLQLTDAERLQVGELPFVSPFAIMNEFIRN